MPSVATTELGALFASYAYLEAASVPAFCALARELAAHGAHQDLVDGARRAARDERRHTKTMEALAHRYGGARARPRVRKHGVRSLEALALENEVEGCVRETFGALLAAWQARAARDVAVRTAMASIAEDEARHAALAWSVAAWSRAMLDDDAKGRIADARRRAIAELEAELALEPSPALVRHAGLPTAGQARAMLRALLAATAQGLPT